MNTRQGIGFRVEELACYGFAVNETLKADEREAIVAYARSFEECAHSQGELEAMDDKSLVQAAYGAMSDYANGQL